MNRLRSSLAIVTLALLLAGGLAIFAQGHRGGGPPEYGFEGHGRGFGFLGAMAHELDLTDAQRQELHGRIDQAMEGELGQLMRERDQKHQALRQLIHDPSAEESAITDAVRSATADAERLALAQHRLSVSVFEVLTPEQREQALQLLAERPQRMQRRLHQHQPPSAPETED